MRLWLRADDLLRIHPIGFRLLRERTRLHRCRLFRVKSWVQANGAVLCTCNRLVPISEMPLPWSFERVRLFNVHYRQL